MDALELTVDSGRPANAGRFFTLGADLLALLDELTERPVMWQITELRTGSAVALIEPPATEPEHAPALRLVVDSLARVSGGNGVPSDWTPDAVKAAHRLTGHGQRAEGEADWVPPRLRLVSGEGRPAPVVALTPELGERLKALQPFERKMPGSVRGEVVGVNVSRGNRASLRLPTKRIVRLHFPTALREELKAAMYQQVEVRGQVRQDGDGRVFHVEVEGVRVLVKPDVRWVDVFGIDPEFTGDLTIDEYLEAHRGEA